MRSRVSGAAAAARGVEGRDFLRRNRVGIARIAAGLVACAVLAGVLASRPGSPRPALPLGAGQEAEAPAISLTSDWKAALRAALPRRSRQSLLSRADRESEAAIEAEIGKLAAFFEESKRGAKPFADEVLGLEAKLRLTGSKLENGANAVYAFFRGTGDRGPDRFNRYVRDCFERHVLKRTQVQKAIDGAFAGYQAELERIEARLLVDLRADLDASEIGVMRPLAPMKAEAIVSDAWNRAIADAADWASNDLCVSIGKFALSWIGGDMAEKQITSANDSALKRHGVNLAAGAAIDMALDEGLAARLRSGRPHRRRGGGEARRNTPPGDRRRMEIPDRDSEWPPIGAERRQVRGPRFRLRAAVVRIGRPRPRRPGFGGRKVERRDGSGCETKAARGACRPQRREKGRAPSPRLQPGALGTGGVEGRPRAR